MLTSQIAARCRPVLAALGLLAWGGVGLVPVVLGTSDPARAVEPVPSEEDEGRIDQCLDAVGKAGSDARACVGVVADNCLDGLEEDSSDESIACMARETELWQRLLDQRRSELQSRLDSPGDEVLESVQESWEAYRTHRCDFAETIFSEGSNARMWRANCVLEETGRRAIELGGLLQDLESR